MTTCEFKKLCDEVCDGIQDCVLSKYDEIKACEDHRTFERIFNSPQFKRQSEEKIRKAIDDFREVLVEAVKNGYVPLTHISIVENAKETICEIIRTHGKETE